MKKITLIYALGILFLTSCDNGLKSGDIEFSVSTSSTTVCPGDSVIFNFDGNPDYIVYWSGEPLSDYEYRKGRSIDAGLQYNLTFSSKIMKGVQHGQISILVSNDFNGNYDDYENIIRTSWTDITSKLKWASNADVVSSGKLSLNDYLLEDKSLYIAFRYKTLPQAEYGVASNWVVSDFKVTNVTDKAGEVVLYDLTRAGFRVIDPFMRTDASGNCTVSSSQLSFMGPFGTEDATGQLVYPLEASEQWIISAPLRSADIIDLGPDRPKAIKGFSQKMPSTFAYAYDAPGTYRAVFVASNQTIGSKSEVVRTLEITVSDEEME